MPQVPTYTAQVQTEALPGARETFSPGNPGAAIGAGLSKVGNDIANVAIDEQKKQGEVAVLAGDRQLSEWSINALYNPQTGALNAKGKDAFGLPDTVMPEFDKTAASIRASLSNQDQRDAFDKFIPSRRNQVEQQLYSHVSQEMKSYQNNELDAYIKTAQNSALANPAGAQVELDRQRMAITSYAHTNGMGPEWLNLKTGEAASGTHLGIVDGLLAQGQDQQAQAYYTANAGQFLAEDKTRAEKALEVGTLRGQSQRAADAITTSYNDPAAMMSAVEQIKDPKLRDATEQRVERKIRFLADVNKQAMDQTFSKAWTTIEQTGSADNVPPADWGALAPQQRKALEAYAKQKQSGEDVPNNDAKWLEFLKLPDRTLNDMSEADLLSKYIPEFDKAHRERAMTRWGQVKDAANGNKTAAVKHAATKTFDDVVSTTLSKAGLGLPVGYSKSDVKKLNEEKQQVVANFESQADSAIKQYEANDLQGKRAANSEEMQKIVDGLLLRKVFVENKIFPGGEVKPAAALTASEQKRVKIQVAPTDPKERTVGESYSTPKGELMWTGTGWVKN